MLTNIHSRGSNTYYFLLNEHYQHFKSTHHDWQTKVPAIQHWTQGPNTKCPFVVVCLVRCLARTQFVCSFGRLILGSFHSSVRHITSFYCRVSFIYVATSFVGLTYKPNTKILVCETSPAANIIMLHHHKFPV